MDRSHRNGCGVRGTHPTRAARPPLRQAPLKLVIDASILVDHIRERGPATTLLSAAIERGDELWSSQVIRAEVLAGMRPSEGPSTHSLLSLLRWADISTAEADGAGALGQRFLRTRPGIDTPDLLLAELAQRLGAELVTMNVEHFPMFPELKPPYSY